MLGILSEYVGLIYEEVKARPNYLVTEVIGFRGDD
jgi:dolichol-phosphate mannosyltransferase